jgi:predicted secreted protein
MANKVATNGYLLLDSGGTNSIDVSVNLTSFNFSIDGKSVPVTAMGDTWDQILAGLKNWSADAQILYDDTAAGQDIKLTAIAGTIVVIKFGPSGSTPGATTPIWTGSALIGSFKNSWTVNEAMAISLSMTGAGAVVRAEA